ncbi:MAG: DUF2155 domain-containing protein [Parvibaculum sp.]
MAMFCKSGPAFFALCLLVMAAPVVADPLPIAEFSGLDKISTRISSFDVTVGNSARFGALQVLVRSCDKSPPEEPPRTAAYVEIFQVNEQTNEVDKQAIFKGWMFAESPGLNGLEHPVYDVWLNTCKTSSGAASDSSR